MITTIGILVGGLGLLLVGMSMMTDGLKLAAGNSLRDLLALWTNSRLRGLFAGFLITGLVQSSSAVTVATIGFANAGMLTLEQSLWVIFGSNVGTTMTAWIVALVGFKLNIEALALPLIGIGAVLKLTGGDSTRAPIGMAIVGFGMLFLGIGSLKDAFETVGGKVDLPIGENLTFLLLLTYVGTGIILTTLMQSSSAAMVVAISAAEGGLLPFNAAAAIVIGANLGTTTTAIFSVFGATATARRVALGHVSFNVITAIVAMLLLGPMLWLAGTVQGLLNMEASTSVALAVFHSVFNFLGVLLMWPLSGWMTGMLHKRFQTDEETESRPKYLDKNVLALPYIAVDALALELSRVANFTVQLLQKNLHIGAQGNRESAIISSLSKEIGAFSSDLGKRELTPFVSEALLNLMHATQEYLLTVEIAEDVGALKKRTAGINTAEFAEEMDAFVAAADAMLDMLTPDNFSSDIENPESYEHVDQKYKLLKEAALMNASFGSLTMGEMDELLQYANQVKRGCRHLRKAARRLDTVRASLQRAPEDQVVASSETDESNIQMLQQTETSLNEDSSPAS
ncbi:MAG: Na/Pi cotransporter family protein [Gammaproteobacteria bacterium]